MEVPENLCVYPNCNDPNGYAPDPCNYGENTSSPPYQFNVIPFQIENNLNFIDIAEDGTTLLGSSNINGKYWNGSIWSFKDVSSAPCKEKSITGFGLEYGVTCGKFIGDPDVVVIGDEGGGVSTIRFQELSNTIHCMPLFTTYCHDQAVTSLSVSNDLKNTVSSSTDSSIAILENDNLALTKKYSPAHGREVTCIAISKYHSNLIFGSTSLDGSLLLWDHRESKPAIGLKDDSREPLTVVDWKSENEIAFASSFGTISLFDIRYHQSLHCEKVFDIPISSISFNKYGLLAISSQWNEVIVWDFEMSTKLFRDSRHNGLIHCVFWHPTNEKLYSCGDHKTILEHDVDLSAYK